MVKQTGFITSDLATVVKPTHSKRSIYCLHVTKTGDNLSARQNQNRRRHSNFSAAFNNKMNLRVAIH